MVLELLLAFGVIGRDAHLSREMARAACAEAAAVWQPYGVVLTCELASELHAPAAHGRPTIVIESGARAIRRGGDEPLGAIDFDDCGAPGPTLAVFFDAIVRLVSETPVADVRFSAWPIAARERFLSRALGRVIAHEIGHYLLGPRHSSGLMRRAFSAADLVDRSSARFRLSALDVQRLPRTDAAAAQH